MRKLLGVWLLAFVPAVGAGTLTVNGIACGLWTQASMSPAGDLTVTADGSCGTVTPPPVEPPVPPPSACPAGVSCVDKTFPIAQQVVTLKAGQVVAIKVPGDAAGTSRQITSAITSTGLTTSRKLSISTTAGDIDPANTRCATRGWEVVSLTYKSGDSGGARGCFVPANQPIYINLAPTNCPEGQRCDVYIKGQ